MSIAAIVLALTKLRQERHGNWRCISRRDQGLNYKHAAPNGAWGTFWGSTSINMALLTELSQTRIPPKAAKNRRAS
jgi:hypothetical protein